MQTYKRTLPQLDVDNSLLWTSGADGVLKFQRCQQCGYYLHPSGYICPQCLSRELAPSPVSGKGTVEAFTINRQPWAPQMPTPYVYAFVRLIEQSDLRLITNIINIAPEAVRCEMPVRVVFERDEDVWLPLFEPDAIV